MKQILEIHRPLDFHDWRYQARRKKRFGPLVLVKRNKTLRIVNLASLFSQKNWMTKSNSSAIDWLGHFQKSHANTSKPLKAESQSEMVKSVSWNGN